MKFLSYNIQYGIGLDETYDLPRVAEVLKDADVIALQEVERHWSRTNDDDQVAGLAELLPDHHWVFGAGFDTDASYRDGGGRLVNKRRQFGCMLMSRLPIVWSRCHIWPHRRTIAPYNMQGQALEGMIRTPWGPIRVLSMHLSHIGAEERLSQIEFMLARHRDTPFDGGAWCGSDNDDGDDWEAGETAPENPVAAVWMGDFNATPDSQEYQRMTGRSPYYPVVLHADGFVDSTVAAGHDKNAFISHEEPDGNGGITKRRLDYCFVGAELVPQVRKMWVDENEIASDHKPVWTEIELG